VQNRQGYWLAFTNAENSSFLSFDNHVRSSEVLQSGYDGYARGIDQTAVVIDNVHVCAQGEAPKTSDDAE